MFGRLKESAKYSSFFFFFFAFPSFVCLFQFIHNEGYDEEINQDLENCTAVFHENSMQASFNYFDRVPVVYRQQLHIAFPKRQSSAHSNKE